MNFIKNRFHLTLICSFFFLNIPQILSAQVHQERGALGIMLGMSKYFGSYSSNNLSINADVFGRYNFSDNFGLLGNIGFTRLRYNLDSNIIASDKFYFGDLASNKYPTNGINRDLQNNTNIFSLGFTASYSPFVESAFAPFVFTGINAIYFTPKNATSQNLPNSFNKIYPKFNISVPLGLGAEYYLTEDITINAKAEFNFTPTDYLDDYKDLTKSLPDAFATLSVGGSYYLYGIIDCDKDMIQDRDEKTLGTNPCNADTDGDSLNDYDEAFKYQTDPKLRDTDEDEISDFEELFVYQIDPRRKDTDRDGLTDREELQRKTDPRKADTDGDKLKDGEEVKIYNTDPLKTDTDEDGLSDGDEVLTYKSDPTQLDTDSDGLNDAEEVNEHQTDPTNRDSDMDGLSDYDEIVKYKTLATSADSDIDGLNDGEEIKTKKTDPRNKDTDADGVIDGQDKCPLLAGVAENKGCPEPKETGDILEVSGISFVKNSFKPDLKDKSTVLGLTQLVQYITQCKEMSVIVQSHCEALADPKKNRELSEQRAEAVKKWLIEQGINPNKIEAAIGYGSRTSNATKIDTSIINGSKISKSKDKIAIRIIEPCDVK